MDTDRGNRNKTEEEVAQTMRALEGIDRAATDDLFYERLQKKLPKREEKRTPWFAAAAAVIGLLVLFNVFTVIEYGESYVETSAATVEKVDPMELVWEYEVEPMLAGYDIIENYELTGRD